MTTAKPQFAITIVCFYITISRSGIPARNDFQRIKGKFKCINNKIKTMKRQAYGYGNMDFFRLKLLSLYASTSPFSG